METSRAGSFEVKDGKDGPEIWLTVALEGRWVARYRLIADRGLPVVAELRIEATPPPKTLKPRSIPLQARDGSRFFPEGTKEFEEVASDLPAVPRGGLRASVARTALGKHRAYAREFLSRWNTERAKAAAPSGAKPAPGFAEGLGFVSEARSRRKGHRAGRRALPVTFYLRWAERYARLAEGGGGREPSRRPCALLAKRHRVPSERVRNYVRRARQLDLLTGGRDAGRDRAAEGSLTDRARALLQRA